MATLATGATNLDQLSLAARAFHDDLHPSLATRNGTSFLWMNGNAWLTCVRKRGEWLVVRLFETEGCHSIATLGFLWAVEKAQVVNLLGEPIGTPAVAARGKSFEVELQPCQIATLRFLFQGCRTEYPDLDAYRSVWVG